MIEYEEEDIYWWEYAIRDDDDNVIGWKPNTPAVAIERYERWLELLKRRREDLQE